MLMTKRMTDPSLAGVMPSADALMLCSMSFKDDLSNGDQQDTLLES